MSGGLGDLLSLAGKTALVTGGSRGIGREISLLLAQAGAFVAVNYLSGENGAQSTLRSIEDAGGEGMLCRFDVGDPGEVDGGVTRILERRGRIHILVNNAGITMDGLLGRMKDDAWKTVIETNLGGAFHLCRSVGRSMIRNRWGRIVNIVSTAGEAGNPGQANYSAAKAGMVGLTKALARELAPRNILVNAVSPGIISGGLSDGLTEEQSEAILQHVPLRRQGRPEEVASAVLFLCSGMARYITGQVIRVNGGLYM